MATENITNYRDRRQAGEHLAAALAEQSFTRPVVLGIPRGGVAVSVEVARRLGADHGVVVARKLGAPMQPELAIGATTASGVAYLNQQIVDDLGIDEAYLDAETARESDTARRYEATFNSHRRPSVADRDAIIIDDGVATGATAIAAIRAMKAEGARRVIFAVPAGPPETVKRLHDEADDVVCLIADPLFFAVGQFHDDFRQVDDDMVRSLLDEFDAIRRSAPTT